MSFVELAAECHAYERKLFNTIHPYQQKRKHMSKVVLNSNVLTADTIATINEPVSVTATLTSGVQVTVPAGTVAGAIVIVDADGTAPSGLLVEGVNLFSEAEAELDLTVIA